MPRLSSSHSDVIAVLAGHRQMWLAASVSFHAPHVRRAHLLFTRSFSEGGRRAPKLRD